MTIQKLLEARQSIRSHNPLVHCITNPISINDCANAILAVGAQPIMAEHPLEAAAITRSASALLVNLGNVTDARLEAARVSGGEALEHGIPCALDLVGVGCSLLRLQFARKFVGDFHPSVIKGNLTELKAFAGTPSQAAGVDAAAGDCLTPENTPQIANQLARLSRRTGAAVLATGATDLVTDGEQVWLLQNGVPLLSRITGTGCVAGALTATYLSACGALTAAALAVSMLGIAGERAAQTARGAGSFRTALLDELNTLDDASFAEALRWQRLSDVSFRRVPHPALSEF